MAKAIYAFIVAVAASLVFTATAMAGGTTYGSMKDGHAEAVHNWSGFHVGAALGYSFTDYDHTHDLFDSTVPYDATTTLNADSDGLTGTITIGYDRQMSHRFVVGVFADYTFGEHDATGMLIYPTGPEGVRFTHEDSWAVGARFGYIVMPSTLVYFNVGYTRGRFEQSSLVNGGSLEDDLDGYFLGVGLVKKLKNGLGLTLEYRYSDYSEKRLGSFTAGACCSESFDIDADNHAIRLGLTLQMGDKTPPRHEPLK